MSDTRLEKILIIGADLGSGSNGKMRWDSLRWDQPRSGVNLHDYDRWVLSVTGFPEDIPDSSVFGYLGVHSVLEALHHEVRIYVFGDPRLNVKFKNSTAPFLNWTGHSFSWKALGGDTIDVKPWNAEDFASVSPYLRTLRRWTYTLRSIHAQQQYVQTGLLATPGQGGNRYQFNLIALATNRHGEGISSALQLTKDGAYGTVFLIPENTDAVGASFREFLSIVFGIETRERAPAWMETLVAPGQQEIDTHIQSLKSQIAVAAGNLSVAENARTSVRQCLEVLYQSGDSLESAVELMLTQLGASVRKPEAKGECDRFLSATFAGDTHEAVLEIKGTKNEQFNIKGIRQVKDWRDNYYIEKQKEAKAIFIGNSDLLTEPSKRPSPFPDQWIKTAEKFEVACISTQVLYGAYSLRQQGKLDIDKFWRILFTTNGVVDSSMLSVALIPRPEADVQ